MIQALFLFMNIEYIALNKISIFYFIVNHNLITTVISLHILSQKET